MVQPAATSLILTPASGPKGTVVSYSGSDCPGPGSFLRVLWVNAAGFPATQMVGDAAELPDGTFSGTFTVPEFEGNDPNGGAPIPLALGAHDIWVDCSGFANPEPSIVATFTVTSPATAPSAPQSVTAAPTNVSGRVRVSWLLPASNGGSPITDYVIQRSTSATSGFVTVADGVSTATSFTVTGLTNGVRYYFRVFARNAVGTSGSPHKLLACDLMVV